MVKGVGEIAREVVDAVTGGGAGAPWVTTTGYDTLDELLAGGLRAGQLVLVGGAPSAGASVLALGIARQAALREAVPTLLVTSDSEREVAARLLAAETRTALSRLREGSVDRETDALVDTVHRLGGSPLFVHEDEGSSQADLLSLVSDWSVRPYGHPGVEHGRLVVLDLVTAGHRWSAERVRSVRRTAIRRRLAVVVVGRLATPADGEQRAALGSHPRFVDVPDPAAFDVVTTLSNPEPEDLQASRRGENELDVVRNRYGSIGGRVHLALQGHYARLVEITPSG